ncbi:MAG: metallophosphoesterase [Propionibacteriales bacterium]|nr:metallophosphoesterase [Propionibacteriales bacterium]
MRSAIGVSAVFLAASLVFSGCAAAAPAMPSVAPSSAPSSATSTTPDEVPLRFAVIGDYGMGDSHAAAVATLVATWKPSFIIATGDDYYNPAGGSGSAKYDRSTGAFYCAWLAEVTTSGKNCPQGKAKTNAFFPALGNHDYSDATPGPATYLSYFTLPGLSFANSSGNERYYDFVQGPVHFFVLNSNSQEPDGISATSVQARWLKAQLAASTSPWNVVYDHHPPYSSDSTHGSSPTMRWPYANWGADVVLSGHSHTYERIQTGGVTYFVNGLGGAGRYGFGAPIPGSKARYDKNWGAQEATATSTTLTFTFRDLTGKTIDSVTLTR